LPSSKKFNEEQAKRHLVCPRLTGYAQLNRRNLTPWHEKFKQDVYYINNILFLLNVKIIIETV